jgi:hypothetical protein
MQRLRNPIMLSILCLGLWFVATPVVAAPGQNPGQKGQNCPGGQGCPGPHLTTSPLAILHPLSAHPIIALALVATCLCVVVLRQRAGRHLIG